MRPLLVALAAILLTSQIAAAQGIAVVVNREAITQLDVAQRQRLLALTGGGRAPARQAVVDELIDERLKFQEARRLRIVVTDAQVDQAITNIAQRTRLAPQQFTQALAQRGVNVRTLRERLRGDIAWQQVVQQRAQRTLNIRDQDVVDAIRRRGQDPNRIEAFEYTMQQVVVFGGQGADRRRVAEGLRSSLSGCDTIRERLRNVRDVATRDPVRRVDQELPQQLREVLGRTAIGQGTPVQPGATGFEFAVVCSRRPVPGREAVTSQVRQELMGQEMETISRRLLDEAKQKAVIERRPG